MEGLRLSLLGPPQVWREEQPIVLRTRKAVALLAYLAAEGGVHPREQLGALLWPELDAAAARNNLRTVLFPLRQALGSTVLTTTRDAVCWSPSVPVALDLHLLAQAQRTARALSSTHGVRAQLEGAVTAYRGPFLEGLDLPDAPEFETWLAGQRAHWLGVASELLDRLAILCMEEGDLGCAVATLERWVALDPGVEVAWQRLIEAHVARGDLLGARRVWAACQATLAELGVDPSPETAAVAQRIGAQGPAAHAAPATASRGEPTRLDLDALPLVGRGRELTRLHRAYAQAQAGQARVVVLEGAAGSGRTRLARTFLDWTRAQGTDPLLGRAFAPGGGLPFAPLVAALRGRLERENAPDDLLSDLWLAELARLLPELRERYPDLPPSIADETVGEGRLFEAVARLGQSLAARAPLVLALDDVQWTDALTRDTLRYAVQRWIEGGVRAIVLLMVQAEAVGQERELAQWLGHLEREAPVLRLVLGALTPEDVAQMLAMLAGPAAGDEPAQAAETVRLGFWLAQETAGQPAALVGRLRALLEDGTLALRPTAGGGWTFAVAHALPEHRAPTEHAAAAGLPGRVAWGEAPDTSAFHGRDAELQRLGQWLLVDRCRMVGLLGLGGIGKTTLATRLAREVAPHFEVLYWRGLRNAPPVEDWLAGALHLLSAEQDALPAGEEARLALLVEHLRARRGLLILDNLETVLQPGEREVRYREGYQAYGQVLQRLAETSHQSCILVTSREQPPELGPLAGEQAPVRVLHLGGLGTEDSQVILRDKGLAGDEAAWRALVARYGGNPLALKMVGETIGEVFGGDLAAFLAQGEAVFGDIRRLLDRQVERLSSLERSLLSWLAVEREPVGFGDLVADLGPVAGRGMALEALGALRQRSLIEPGERGATVTLQPVVLEYATERLVADLAEEIVAGRPVLLVSHALLKATARDYVRRSQELLIAMPILEWLVGACGTPIEAERRLVRLLDGWRGRPALEQGYGPGNAVNLLRLLRGDLRGLDLSRLAIRQTYLQGVEAQDASLAGAQLAEAVLAEAFNYPASVALSADGACLVAGTSTGEVRLWRVADRTPLVSAQGHTGVILSVALSGDGRLVASGSQDGTIKLWEGGSGKLLATLQGHTGGVAGVALSRDGRLVASGSFDGTVKLWDGGSGQLLATLRGHTGGVRGVALSGDGQLLVSGSYDGTVKLWATQSAPGSGQLLATLRGHTGGVWGVALSGDGRLLASGSFDGTVKLWATQSAPGSDPLLATLQGHAGGVAGVALSRDGQLLTSGSQDGTVKVWEAPSGHLLTTLHGHTGGVRGVALSGDGRLVVSGSFDGTARLWEAPSGRPLATLQGHTSEVAGVALSRDGQLLASGNQDGMVRLWEAGSGQLLATLHGHTSGVRGVALSGDGQLVASGSFDGTVRLWHVETGRPLATLHGYAGGVWGVALSGDGRLVTGGSEDGTARVWEAPSGQLLATLHGHAAGVRGVALSRDGQLLASGSQDGTVRIWEAPSGQLLATLQGHAAGVRGVALSGDGQLVASGSEDGTVRLWEVASGETLVTLQGHTGGVWGVVLSGDGRLVVSGSFDGTVRLWDVETGRARAILRGHTAGVWGVALSGDGQLVVSGSFDGTVRLWDVGSGECLRTLRPDRRYERMDITGLSGVTTAQKAALLALGAEERQA